MKTFNLIRLIEASPFSKQLSEKAKEALIEYYLEIDVDLNKVNIDNDIVNGITIVDKEEYEKYQDKYYLLCEDTGDYYVFQ